MVRRTKNLTYDVQKIWRKLALSGSCNNPSFTACGCGTVQSLPTPEDPGLNPRTVIYWKGKKQKRPILWKCAEINAALLLDANLSRNV